MLVHAMGAVLRFAGYRSGYSYLLDAKLAHIRSGYGWNPELDLAMKDAERALTWGLGPPAKSEEVRLVWLRHLLGRATVVTRCCVEGRSFTSCGWAWTAGHNPTRLLFQLSEAPADAVKCINCSW